MNLPKTNSQGPEATKSLIPFSTNYRVTHQVGKWVGLTLILGIPPCCLCSWQLKLRPTSRGTPKSRPDIVTDLYTYSNTTLSKLTPNIHLHLVCFQVFYEGVSGARHSRRPQHRRERAHGQVLMGKGVGRPQQPLSKQPGMALKSNVYLHQNSHLNSFIS